MHFHACPLGKTKHPLKQILERIHGTNDENGKTIHRELMWHVTRDHLPLEV